MPRRRTSRRRASRRPLVRNSAKRMLREVDTILSTAEDELEGGSVMKALAAYMMASDLACSSGIAREAEHDDIVSREWTAVSREMAMVLDEIGERLRQAGVR
jgi:hypothetical protein